jgi:hypothetical protein
MTGREEPSDEELARAERIRRLRTGGERSRGHEMRERRREAAEEVERPDDAHEGDGADGSAPDETAADGADDGDEDSDDGSDDGNPLPAAGDANVLEMAATLPEDGSLFVVPVREGLRREFNKVAEQLHLRYGFAYESELDAETHVRPLALYLGVQALEDSDAEVVRELLDSVDDLAAPGGDDG